MPSYTDPIVYYGDNLIDPLQQNYSHLQQGKQQNIHCTKKSFLL